MLHITRPTRSANITQGFGVNMACIDRDGRVVSASRVPWSSGYRDGVCPANTKPLYQSMGMKGHNGIDIATWTGESVIHAGMFDGIMKTHVDSSGGIGVDVVSKEPQKLADGTESIVKIRYWHLKCPIGYDGKEVRYGQIIGLADNTGNSSGSHLHWGLKKCDKYGNAYDKDNGYYGAIDPFPYYDHKTFAGDSAEYLNIAPKLSVDDRKQLSEQLSIVRRTALALRELISKL